jgi:hypothetical protein
MNKTFKIFFKIFYVISIITLIISLYFSVKEYLSNGDNSLGFIVASMIAIGALISTFFLYLLLKDKK